MKRNYKRMALSAGMALVLAIMPVTAMGRNFKKRTSEDFQYKYN